MRIETDDTVVDYRAFDSPHLQLLVAYLVCERGRPVARTEILELLTPDDGRAIDLDGLFAHLADAIAAALPMATFRAGPGTVELGLPKDTWVDIEAAADAIHEAESALRRRRAADAFGPSAIAHHIARRPFLPGERGSWVEANRERLRGILVRALEARGEVFLSNAETSLAVEAAREVVKLEPYRETGHQLLVRALAASGNNAEATRAYERCRRLLRDELGIEPSPQTQRVFDSLAASGRGRANPDTADVAPQVPASTHLLDVRALVERALGSQYSLERELTGGMSKVFVARERALGRLVVIKVPPLGRAEPAATERFAREVLLAARLQHPNIVPVLSAGVIEGALPYYTMPYVSGESLRARLGSAVPLAFPQIASILWDVARALACAHAAGVVHRDIKPENILLSGDAAVVTDFGIAKAINGSGADAAGQIDQALTSTGSVVGTPRYMAPEQIVGESSIDHRADIYSFGVVAYELLAGRVPFADRGLRELVAARLSESPQDVRVLRPAIPANLSTIVMSCLQKEPDARPQNMTDVIVQLSA